MPIIRNKRFRRINRYRDITLAMISQGFGYIVEEIGLISKLPFSKQIFPGYAAKNAKSLGERVRLVLEALGPTYIKLGQIASTRQDLFPPDVIQELEKLQDSAPFFPLDQVAALIQKELGAPLDTIFQQFDLTPLAAASIGQVHRGVLKSGAAVAVKLQRPGIAAIIDTDLEILYHLVSLVERRFKWAENYQIVAMVTEFSKSLRNELDYSIEARNAEKIAKQTGARPHFHIPKVYWDYSTKKVLTTEYIEGIKINEPDKLEQQGFNLHQLAEDLVKGILHQIFIAGFFHGDPHPGNIIVLPNGVIGLIDFGMAGRLGPEMRFHLASMMIALMRQDAAGIVKAILALGMTPDNVNLTQLSDDIDQLLDQYYQAPLSQIGLGEAFSTLSATVFKYHIRFPAVLTMLGKTLITLEGITQKLDPQFSVISVAEPVGRQLLWERLRPKNLVRQVWKNATDISDLVLSFPKHFKELTSFIKQGRLRLEVTIPEMELFLKKQERIMNRLSLCIMLLSGCIMMAGIIIGLSFTGQHTVLKNPVVEIGFGIVIIMFTLLFLAIIRSGGL